MSIVPTIIAAGVVLILLVFLAVLGLLAQKRPVTTGYEGMVGERGVIRKAKGFRGRQVMEVRGELWWCRSDTPLAPGTEAIVSALDPDAPVLIVEPC